MNRKEFLKVMGGAAATAAAISVPSLGAASASEGRATPRVPAPPPGKLTRGISFYSYQAAYYSGMMSVEDCVAEAGSIGT
jgi:hypothetical protein